MTRQLDPAELERRILQALASSGGSIRRHDLHVAIGAYIRAAHMDEVLSSLRSRGLLRQEQRTGLAEYHTGQMPIRYTLYTLESPKPKPTRRGRAKTR